MLNSPIAAADHQWLLREVYSSHVYTELAISNASLGLKEQIEPVGDVGVVLCSSSASTNSSSSSRLRSVLLPPDCFQSDQYASVCFLPGNDRLYLSHTGLDCLLDLSSSTFRDRVVLRHGMRLVWGDGDFTAEVALVTATTTAAAKTRRRKQPPPPASPVRRRVRFSSTLRCSHVDGTESLAELEDDDEDEDDEEEEQNDDDDAVLLLLSNQTPPIRLSRHHPIVYLLESGEAQHTSAPSAVACVVLSAPDRALHLLLPRVSRTSSSSSAAAVFLCIPGSTRFPVQSGDVFTLNHSTRVQVQMPQLSRGLPASKRAAMSVNASYDMQSIALACTVDSRRTGRWNKSISHFSAPASAVSPVSVVWDFLSPPPPVAAGAAGAAWSVGIGKRPGVDGVAVPDRTLANVHATIERHDSAAGGRSFFTAQPVRDFKDVYQLVGKRESHKRASPVPLRLGDIFAAGKSVFCVVFQQRGNRRVVMRGEEQPYTVQQELEERAQPASLQSRTSARPEHQPQPHTTLDDEEDDEDEGAFQHLHLDDDDDSYNSAAAAATPSFQDLHSLLDFFDLSVHDNLPLMAVLALRGPSANQYFMVNALETIIGSSQAHASICIPNDRKMSPVHCRLYFDEGMERWLLEDVESASGTFCKIGMMDPLLLCPGDVLCMGKTALKVYGSRLPLAEIRARVAQAQAAATAALEEQEEQQRRTQETTASVAAVETAREEANAAVVDWRAVLLAVVVAMLAGVLVCAATPDRW